MKIIKIGVLALHGDVSEHIKATNSAAATLGFKVNVAEVRTKPDLLGINGLIIPGGESTTLQKLSDREGMTQGLKNTKNIFGTCAGAILLAKIIHNKMEGQKTLKLMDIEVDRNAYGRQNDSFEEIIKTSFGNINAIFIRAPKIKRIGKNVKSLAKYKDEVIACEEKAEDKYYLATCFHPELTTTKFHQHFLEEIIKND